MFFHRLMQRSGSFFRKLFLSYLLILLFLCGIMLFLSQQLIRSISVYAESEAKQSVASYRSAIEGVLTSLSTLSQELTTDASLRACIACEGDFPVEIRYGLPQVIDKFGSYKFLRQHRTIHKRHFSEQQQPRKARITLLIDSREHTASSRQAGPVSQRQIC